MEAAAAGLRRALWGAAESVAAAFAPAGGDSDSDDGPPRGARGPRSARSLASVASSSYASLPPDDGDGDDDGRPCAAPSPQAMRRGPPLGGGGQPWRWEDNGDDGDAPAGPPAPPFVPGTPLPQPASPPPTLDGPPGALLTPDLASRLAASLPATLAVAGGRPWRCAYSTARDGTSLATLFRAASAAPPTTQLLVRDARGAVFGAFAAAPWAPGRRGYYGGGEAFVFTAAPVPALWRWHAARCDVARNDFFQLARPAMLALGGGPAFALALDADLGRGRSGPCETFGSPCLASGDEYEVGRVELWAVG